MENKFLRKRERTKSHKQETVKQKKNTRSKHTAKCPIEYSNESANFDENVKFSQDDINALNSVQREQMKIAKHWEGKSLIEPKNTTGIVSIIEAENIMLSIVDDNLLVLDITDLSIKGTIRQNEEAIIAFAYNPIKREVICLMNISMVRVYSIDTLKCTREFKIHKSVGKIIRLDPSYKFFAVGTSMNTILVYDTVTFNLEATFQGHSGFIYDICFNPDKEKYLLYSCSEDGSVKIWNLIFRKCTGSLDGHSSSVRHIVLTNDGKFLISSTFDNQIYIWKLFPENNNDPPKVIHYDNHIHSLLYFTRINPNKKKQRAIIPSLLIGCEDGTIQELNLPTEQPRACAKFINQPIMQLHYSHQLKRLYALTSEQVMLYIEVDLVSQQLENAQCSKIYPGYCQELLDIKMLPPSNSGNLNFLFSSNDSLLKYYDKSKSAVKLFESHSDFIMNIEIMGEYISTSSKDNTLRIWKWRYSNEEFQCECIAILRGHSESVNYSSLIVKKGYMVVSASKDGCIKVWDFASAVSANDLVTINESLYSEIAHEDEINVVKVSPNEQLIASGSYDKSIKIWGSDLTLIGTITGHKRAVTDIAFSPYAKILASSSTDKSIKIWNINDFTCLNTFEGHLSSVLKLGWIYHATHLISAGADGLVKFWNIKTSECINTITAHEGKIWALDISTTENETKFITGGADSKIISWNDVTSIKQAMELHKEEEKIVKQEELRKLNMNKEYLKAMQLSLELNHKNDFMMTFQKFIHESLKGSGDVAMQVDQIALIIDNRKYLESTEESEDYCIVKEYQANLKKVLDNKYLRKIIKENLGKILDIIRDNNIKSSTFFYVQILLKIILTSTNFEALFNLKPPHENDVNSKSSIKEKKDKPFNDSKKSDGYLDNLEIVKLFSEKHLERINREITKSYLIDYVIEKMKLV